MSQSSDNRRSLTSILAIVVAALGIISAITGIIGISVLDIFGGGSDNLTQAEIIGTLAALQDDKQAAELQLTQIALENVQAANVSTQQAIAQQQADFQATLDAIQGEQDAVLATQNAQSAATATQDAADALATQAAQDAIATANAVAQILPTDTPVPTATPVPAVVSDHRSLSSADVQFTNQGQISFSVRTDQPIPNEPQNGLAYVWSLDTDFNAETGLALQDIGVDVRVSAIYENGGWLGKVTVFQPDGTVGETFLFIDIGTNGPNLTADLTPGDVSIPSQFFWIARAELGGEAYSFVPSAGHNTLQ